MSSPGSGTPGSNVAGAVAGTTSAGVPEAQPVNQGIVQANQFRAKGTAARDVTTGEASPGAQTSDQIKAEAEQANIKELGFTPGAQFPSTAEVNQKVSNLGIKYESQTPNLVNGVLTSGQPSPRDLYVQTLLTEVATGYKGQGFKTEEDYLSNRLNQVGLAYNPQTKTITDPLVEKLVSEEKYNEINGGYAGISFGGGAVDIGGLTIGGSSKAPTGDISKAYGGLAQFTPNPNYDSLVTSKNPTGSLDIAVKGLNKSQAQNIENNVSDIISNAGKSDIGSGGGGPDTALSLKLGSSFGQKGLGYQQAINPDGTLNYGPSQIASLISSVKNNPEYGNNQNFLVGDIGTQNSIGSLAALNLNQTHNTDIPNSLANHNKTLSLSDTLGISEGIGGGSNLGNEGSNALGKGLASLSIQQAQQHNLGVALQQVSNQQIEAKNLGIEESNQVIEQLNNNAKVNFAVDYLLGNKPQSRYTGTAAILPPAGTDIVRAGLGFVKGTFTELYADLASLVERASKANIFSSNPLNITSPFNIITEHEQAIYERNTPPQINLVKGTETFVTTGSLSDFSSGQGPVYDITQGALTLGTFLIGSRITEAPKLISVLIAKSGLGKAIGQEAKSAAIIYANKGSNVFNQGTAEAEVPSMSLTRNVPTYKNLNMMRTPLPKDIFESDIANGIRPIGSASVEIPKNNTLETTSSQIDKLRQSTSDLLKPSSIEPLSNKPIPVSEDALFINKVPMKSLGSNNGIGNQIKQVNTNALLPGGEVPLEDQTGGTGPPVKKPVETTTSSLSPLDASLGNLPGSGVPGSGVAGSVGGQAGAGVPDVFQQALSSRVDFERRLSERANPDLFESDFVPNSKTFTAEEFRMTLKGKQDEALKAFNVQLNPNEELISRPLMPKELSKNSKLSKLISSQTVGARPEIFGTSQEVKLKLEDIEYNPAEHYQVPLPKTGKSPFDIQFGDIVLFSKQEFTSNLLSPEEQALAERYPLMKNTLPNNLNPFNEPRTTPRTGTAPIQKDTFNISETVKGREEAKFFGTFELKTKFEDIGYVPRNENPIFIKTIPSGQRIEALDLFKTGLKAKLNPTKYQGEGVPKELMGNFSKLMSTQTTGIKLPEIFGEKEAKIIKENFTDVFYSPQQEIRQFFERLESNKPNVHNNSNLKGYGIEKLELNITKNKTKINTNKLLGIDTEEPSIGESKERLEDIIKGGLSRDRRESKLTKLIQTNEEDIFSNARSFFQNVKEQTPFINSEIPIEKGEFHTLTGKRERILNDPFYFLNEKDHEGKGSDFGGLFTKPPPRKPPGTPETPKDNKGELVGRNGLVQIVKEEEKTEKLKQEILPKQEEIPKAEELIKTKKKGYSNTSLAAILLSNRTTQETQQTQKQSTDLINIQLLKSGVKQKPKQAQSLIFKPMQKQDQPQAFALISMQEQSPAVAQLFKPLQSQKLKQPQLTRQLEENPFPSVPPQKQLELLDQIPQFPPQFPHTEPPKPPFGLPDDHKKHPKRKKAKGDRYNFIGNVPEFDIAGVFKRNEIIYGQKTINRLTNQDTKNLNKKYSEKYNTGKTKTLFTSKNNKIKVKGSQSKPKSFENKYKKKVKI